MIIRAMDYIKEVKETFLMNMGKNYVVLMIFHYVPSFFAGMELKQLQPLIVDVRQYIMVMG